MIWGVIKEASVILFGLFCVFMLVSASSHRYYRKIDDNTSWLKVGHNPHSE